MELIYLWIEDYKSIKRQEIIFSSHYKLNRDSNLKSFLKFENQTYEYYKPIEKITALIGKNGSGKSSILEVLVHLIGGDPSIDAYIVFEDDGELKWFGNAKNGHFEESIKEVEYKKFKSRKKAIYYSSVYSPHNLELNNLLKTAPRRHNRLDSEILQSNENASRFQDNIVNVSNNYLYSSGIAKNQLIDLKDQFIFLENNEVFAESFLGFNKYFRAELMEIKFKNIYPKLSYLIQKYTDMTEYKNRDNKNILILKKLLSEINQLFPDQINFSLDLHSSKAQVGSGGVRLNNLVENFEELFDKLENNINERIKTSDLENQLITSYTLLAIEDEVILWRDNDVYTMFLISLFMKTQNNLTLEIFEECESYYSKHLEDLELILKFKEKILNFMATSKDLSNTITMNNLGTHFPLNFDTHNSKKALIFVKEIQKNKYSEVSINISWNGMSSGQIAKLNIFSRLYRGLLHTSRERKFQKDSRLVILLDEADIYLHPEWQRMFLSELQNFFTNVFQGYKVELIFTSHSPILVSDLIKEDVYVVEKYPSSGLTLISQADFETFASNIHTMYQKGFFLDRTMGQLAYKYIEKLQDTIEGTESPTIDQLNNWLYLIGKIGEPVIKMGLENLIKSKKGTQNNMIEYYKLEIEKLTRDNS